MDSVNEDVSTRLLLKNIIYNDPPRTPVTRSAAAAQRSTTAPRRSSRRSNAGAVMPQDALRRSLKQKLRESTTRVSVPPPSKRRTVSAGVRNTPGPVPPAPLLDNDDTPRVLLRRILQTEPEKSPMVQEKPEAKEPELPSANSSLTSNRPSTGLDLSDVPTADSASTVKGLSRKRPRRSLNVTAFEKHLGDCLTTEDDESADDLSSLSSMSSTLSLKTPFVGAQTEKRGLQRKVANRQKFSVEQFDLAVQNRGEDGYVEACASETAHSEGFTLGLSHQSVADITTDIFHQNTALYANTAGRNATFSLASTQDKDTVTATQIQRDVGDMGEGEQAEEEEGMDLELGQQVAEEEAAAQSQISQDEAEVESQNEEEEAADESQNEEKEADVESQQEEEEADVESQQEEEEADVESQQEEEEADVESQQDEEEADVESQQEEEEADVESQQEEDKALDDSQNEEEEALVESQNEEEEALVESQNEEEEALVESQNEEEEALVESQNEEEEALVESQNEEEEALVESQNEEEEALAESQNEEEEALEESQNEEKESAAESEDEDAEVQSQEAEVESQEGEAGEPRPEEEEEEEEEEEQQPEEEAMESATKEEMAEFVVGEDEDAAVDSQTAEEEEEEEDEEPAERPTEGEDGTRVDEVDGEATSKWQPHDAEHISRRAVRSEGQLVMLATMEGGRGVKSMGAVPGATEAGGEWHRGPQMEGGGISQTSRLFKVEGGGLSLPHDGSVGAEVSSGLEKENYAEEHSAASPVAGPDAAQELSGQEEEEEWEEEDEEEEFRERSMKTPSFVKDKRRFFLTESAVDHNVQPRTSGSGDDVAPVKPTKAGARQRRPAKKEPGLPKTYLMYMFKHFAKTRVSRDVYPVLQEIMDKFFNRMALDLEVYSKHAKRKTIEVEDVELLLRRQGYVNDKVPVEVLIEKYLPMEYRRLLIPIATSGNIVIPKKR